jgi:hypothetical protein
MIFQKQIFGPMCFDFLLNFSQIFLIVTNSKRDVIIHATNRDVAGSIPDGVTSFSLT